MPGVNFLQPLAPRRQRGAALIIAMLIMALAVSVTSAMLASQEVDVRRSSNLLHTGQINLYWRGAENWVAQILGRDAEDSDIDHLGQDWARELPPMPVDGGFIQGRIIDLQSRFNLNSLLQPDGEPNEAAVEMFQRLLINLELDENIAVALLDWLDEDLEPRFPGGAEDDHYLGLDPPYRVANRQLESPSELRLLAGVDRDAWRALRPYVAALPGVTAVNVNTADPMILMALADNIDASQLERLVSEREVEPFHNTGDFLAHDAFAGLSIEDALLSATSNYFLMAARIEVGNLDAELYSLLHRQQNGRVHIVSRRRGTR